jgi:hypothetical protein
VCTRKAWRSASKRLFYELVLYLTGVHIVILEFNSNKADHKSSGVGEKY